MRRMVPRDIEISFLASMSKGCKVKSASDADRRRRIDSREGDQGAAAGVVDRLDAGDAPPRLRWRFMTWAASSDSALSGPVIKIAFASAIAPAIRFK